jgi:hypothetical protein
MFRFRRWLFCATLALGPRLGATPPLSTIQDVLFTSDGNRFNGFVNISWQGFEASDTSNVAAGSTRVRIINGNLYVQLVPTTDALTALVYTIQYTSNGKTQFSEAWAVPPSLALLRVRDVRLPAGSVSGSGGNGGGGGGAGGATTIQISDVVGLQSALNIRPTSGVGFSVSRAAVISPIGAIDGATGSLSDCVHVDGTSAACGTGGSQTPVGFVDAEIPSGTQDGTNSAFAFANIPNPSASVTIFRNGMLQRQSADYTVSGNSLLFLTGAVPQPGDVLFAFYRVGVSIAGVGFVDGETPAGAVNGVNGTFTLAQAPSPAASLAFYRNGIRLKSGVDYTISSNSVTFLTGFVPQTGDTLVSSYRIAQ